MKYRAAWPLAVGLLVAFILTAQEPRGAQQESAGETHSMRDMMQGCQQHCQRTQQSIDQLSKTLEEAKQSNDAAKMRSTLEQAQKPLAEMKEHMSMCMNMMQMHSGMRGMMGPSEKKQSKPDSKDAGKQPQ